ncbi:quinone oxidoreductase-like protein 1 [Aplochiton taeniatus]
MIQNAVIPTVLESHQVKVQVKACALSQLDLKLLGDLGIQKDLIPVGREIAGLVLQVGPQVSFFQPEDEVVEREIMEVLILGILPLDSPCSGLSDVIIADEHCIVHKPEKVSWVCAAGALRDGVSAFTALHTQAGMALGQTLLVLDGASPLGVLCIQLAHYHGVKVLASAHTPQQQTQLEQLRPSIARVVGVWDSKVDLVEMCLEETGGLGVDIVIDSGVRLWEEEPEDKKLLPHKHDIISLLGVGGHWVTSQADLQLDPPDCRLLQLKAASLSFLHMEVWGGSSARQGRFLHILKDLVEKLSTGTLRPLLEEPVTLCEATVAMEMVQRGQRRGVVVQL